MLGNFENYNSNPPNEHEPLVFQLFSLYKEIEKELLNQIHTQNFANLTMVDIQTLYLIKQSGFYAKNLTKKTGTTKQAVSKNINSLVSRKYLSYVEDKEDARAKQILSTKKGERLLIEVYSILKMIESKYENQIGKFTFVQLKMNLQKLLSTHSTSN